MEDLLLTILVALTCPLCLPLVIEKGENDGSCSD